MRKRRIENEWQLLRELVDLNPGALDALERAAGPDGESFRVSLNHTTGPVQCPGGIELRDLHVIHLFFPRFFPSVPIEAVLPDPVFHPNVDPDNGFACLWTHNSPGDSVAEALMRVQRLIAWDLVNLTPDHLIQPAAAKWFQDAARTIALPCAFLPLVLPAPFDYVMAPSPDLRPRRQRLSPCR
jgi:hypothetical protein